MPQKAEPPNPDAFHAKPEALLSFLISGNWNSPALSVRKMNRTFDRYLDTIFHMWKKTPEFIETFKSCKGFCTYHYGILYESGASKLNKTQYEEFISVLNDIYFKNMERVNEDIGWFIDKFDYRYKNEPWKNSKDALPRGIIKTNHTFVE